MNRLTKQIQLVLISSSLTLSGCQREPENDVTCQRPPGNQPVAEAVPPACGPVDGRQVGASHGRHTFIPIPWSAGRTATGGAIPNQTTHGVSGVGGGKSGFTGGKSSVGGSTRGGVGSSGHAGS